MIICRSVAGCADAHGLSGGSDIQMKQTNRAERTLLDMGRYQWLVLFAAWLGWGFDIFDGLLFSFVAPNCVPTLLHIPLGTPEAKAATAPPKAKAKPLTEKDTKKPAKTVKEQGKRGAKKDTEADNLQ